MYSSDLINKGNIMQKCVRRRPGRLRKVGAGKGVPVVKILYPTCEGRHVGLKSFPSNSRLGSVPSPLTVKYFCADVGVKKCNA